ncbi:10388_t:CDS:2, partial [Funneliformis geosporum]
QVAEKRKRLKNKYNALMARKEKDQQKSDSDNLEKQYKSCIFTLEKVMIEKDKIEKLDYGELILAV